MGEFAAKRPLWLCFRMTLEFPFLLEDQVWTLNKKEQDARSLLLGVLFLSVSVQGARRWLFAYLGRRHTHLFILSRIAGTGISGVTGRGGLSRSSCRLLSRPRATPQSEGPCLSVSTHLVESSGCFRDSALLCLIPPPTSCLPLDSSVVMG